MITCPCCGHAFAPEKVEPRRSGMTAKQRDLLAFIRFFTAENDGVPPTYREMQDHMGVASMSGLHRLVSGLEERGFIRKLEHRARSIVVVGEAA
jgi:SOS-response transcriptional repressor LexA